MKTPIRILLALSLGLATPALAAEPKIDTDEQKTIYAIGLALAQSLQPYALKPDEIELVKMGLTDGLSPTAKPKVDLKDYRAKLQQLGQDRTKAAAETEKKAAQAFLDKMAKEKGATKTDSGLIFIQIKEGSGENPKATDTVKVHYHGTLRDGSVFDSSVERGTPATFPLNHVVAVLDRGPAEDEGGRQGEARLPVEHRLRRSRRAAEDQAGCTAGLRGRADRHRGEGGAAGSAARRPPVEREG